MTNRIAFKLVIIVGIAVMVNVFLSVLVLAHDLSSRPAIPVNRLSPPPEASERPQLTYAKVITGDVPVYYSPLDAVNGLAPVRSLGSGYVWVSIDDPTPVNHANRSWYVINRNEYVEAHFLEIFQPSTFRGLARPGSEIFAWVIFDAWTAELPDTLPGDGARLLQRYEVVTILAEEPVGERIWYKVGENQWVEQGMLGLVEPKPRPAGVGYRDKWIEIDLYEQTLAAYEGDHMVYATLISSGLPWWQTVPGLFQVWVKINQAKMSGRDGYPDYYFLEDVPKSMYFNDNFALHGAYWHDRFGIRHSHGCVNLAPADADWLYAWTSPEDQTGWSLASEENVGTWVWVHE